MTTQSFLAHCARLLLACLALAGWVAGVQAQSLAPLSVDDQTIGVVMAPHARLLEDRSGQLDLAAVQAHEGWRPGDGDALSFGFSKSVWWAHWELRNSTDGPLMLDLDLGNAMQDHVHWYVVRTGGQRVFDFASGDRLPFAQRLVPTRNFVLPLDLGPHERVSVYVRLASYDGLFEIMPAKLYTRMAYVAAVEREGLMFTLFHGGLLALGLYNLLLFMSVRSRAFGLYVAYLAAFVTWSFTFRGYSFQYFWPDAPAFNNLLETFSAGCIFAFVGAFGVVYLEMHHSVPRWLWRLNQGLACLNIAAVSPTLLGHQALSSILSLSAGFSLAVVALGTALWLLFRGSRQARFYVAAFAILVTGACAYILQVMNILPSNGLTIWSVQIGSSIEAVVLALGLADSINVMRRQKLAAERHAREAQEALAHRLEQQVRERTEALEHANRRLNELAITDELTGAFNRRHFNTLCAAMLEKRHASDPIAFCMFDLDHFKLYNDHYGHQAGDQVLREVVRAVQQELKRSGDVLFRLGGEEFGVLFTASSSEMALAFIERLREAVNRLGLAHEVSPSERVSASFGVVWWAAESAAGLTPEHMYAAADRMLYEAKADGRNRVAMAG